MERDGDVQFHLNGFRTGDPERRAISTTASDQPDEVDVLIVGAGPTGLTLATQLALIPGITSRIVEAKPGPLELGQADGIACRTMEMFQAFGFSERVLREAYWVNETTFWKPDEAQPDRIVRADRVLDTEEGLSEFPHVILNQARVHDFYLDVMDKAACLAPCYSRRLEGIAVLPDPASPARSLHIASGHSSHPVVATLVRTDSGHEGESEAIRSRFVVGCDGARSAVRSAIGLSLRGDFANQAWGVMDVLARTDFPDVRLKSTIHSSKEGSVLIIPREGGYLVRLYIELEKLSEHQRAASLSIEVDHLIAAAQRILRPYTIEISEVAWWSVYEIGQRLCDKFDDVPAGETENRIPRVFIAGDACHTHSPKAGQGMNVSMQDAFNLGWKLASVISGRSLPRLLHSYSEERRAVAHDLIEFDREFAKLFSTAARDPAASQSTGPTHADFQNYFLQHGRFTAGVATQYAPSMLTQEPPAHTLAQGFMPGMRFHSAPVIRVADAKPMQLGHCARADGRWRLFLFADESDPHNPASKLHTVCAELAENATSPLRRYTPPGADIDHVIDVRCVVQHPHGTIDPAHLPPLLLPRKGRYALIDYEKIFAADQREGSDIYELRGIDRTWGCIVLVRPDQYVSLVAGLDDLSEIGAFFESFMISR